MVTITTIPASAASATTQSLALQFTERMQKFYKDSTLYSTVSFVVDNTSVVAGTVIATVRAVVSVVYQPINKCGRRTEVFEETFPVAFTAIGDNTIAVTSSSTAEAAPTSVKCCVANAVKVTTTATITIS